MSCCRKIPETADKEFDDNRNCVDHLGKVLAHLDRNIIETVALYQQLLMSYEKVSQSYAQISQSGTPASQEFMKEFVNGLKNLREGKGMATLQGDMGKMVRVRYNSVVQECEKVFKMAKPVKDAKMAYDKHRDDITRFELSYAKKNKVLGESKTYKELSKKRDSSRTTYDNKKAEFIKAVNHLKESIGAFTMDTFGGYAAATGSFSKYLGEEMQRQANIAASYRKPEGENSAVAGNRNSLNGNPLA